MNVENIKKVRDHIAGLPPERFDMTAFLGAGKRSGGFVRHLDGVPASTIIHDCNTCGCIAGWTAALLAPGVQYDKIDRAAAKMLGLSPKTADRLFCPAGAGVEWAAITIPQAVTVLDHLLATGEVDWRVAEAVTA